MFRCSCGAPIPAAGVGRPARYCSGACRQRAYRRRGKLPTGLTAGRRWVRADGKRPIRTDGRPASSTDPSTWTNYAEAKASKAGDGLGVMLGDGLGCYDLDHVTDGQARDFIATITEPIVHVERSMSGTGVHVFVSAEEATGWKRTVNGTSVERYTRARFIRATGDRFDY